MRGRGFRTTEEGMEGGGPCKEERTWKRRKDGKEGGGKDGGGKPEGRDEESRLESWKEGG